MMDLDGVASRWEVQIGRRLLPRRLPVQKDVSTRRITRDPNRSDICRQLGVDIALFTGDDIDRTLLWVEVRQRVSDVVLARSQLISDERRYPFWPRLTIDVDVRSGGLAHYLQVASRRLLAFRGGSRWWNRRLGCIRVCLG